MTTSRFRLRDAEKFALARAFESEPNLEFRGWKAALKWVKEKTGLEVTREILVGIRDSAGLQFTILKPRTGGAGNQYSKMRERIEAIESGIAKRDSILEELQVVFKSLSNRFESFERSFSGNRDWSIEQFSEIETKYDSLKYYVSGVTERIDRLAERVESLEKFLNGATYVSGPIVQTNFEDSEAKPSSETDAGYGG